jgi:hypothetical protein
LGLGTLTSPQNVLRTKAAALPVMLAAQGGERHSGVIAGHGDVTVNEAI